MLYQLDLNSFSKEILPGDFREYKGKPEELYGAAKAFMQYGIEKMAFTAREREALQECVKALDAEKEAGGLSGNKAAKNIEKHLLTFCQTQLKEHHITPEEMQEIIQKIPPLDDKDYAKRSYLMHQPKNKALDAPHALLAGLIQHHGGQVTLLENDEASHAKQVFTRDPLIVNHRKKEVYLPDFDATYPKLIAEHTAGQLEFMEHYKKLGYTIISAHMSTEGGDIQPYLSNKGERQELWIGSHLAREDGRLLTAFAKEQELDILLLPQPIAIEERIRGQTKPITNAVDPRFYHLDTFFSALPNGEVLIYEPATTKEACDNLKKRVGEENYIPITEDDAAFMATNLVSVGRTLIMPHCSKTLQDMLEARGYQIVSPETLGLPENFFRFQNGASHCMTNELTQTRPQGVTDDIAALATQYGQEIRNAEQNQSVNNPLLAKRQERSGPHFIG